MKITRATRADIPLIRNLAEKSWNSAYKEILSPNQIEYMLGLMYSEEELLKHFRHQDWFYYLIKGNDENFAGFAGFETNYQVLTAKLHRIYLLPQYKGEGLGKILLNKVKEVAKNHDNSRMILNVNKNNPALDFYKSQGFEIIDEGIFDIGGGYVMDDYILEILL